MKDHKTFSLNAKTHHLEFRAKIDDASPLYIACKNSDQPVFKTIKSLAEEAIAVRAKLQQDAGWDHPYKSALLKLNSAEAVVFLLAITHQQGKEYSQRPTANDAVALSDKPIAALPVAVQAFQREAATGPVNDGQDAEQDDWQRDLDDAHGVLSGLPEMH